MEPNTVLNPPPIEPAQKPVDIFDDFQRLRSKVIEKKPILGEVLHKHGTKCVADYSKEYFDINLNPFLQERQTEFISTFAEEVERLLGKEIAIKAAKQLESYYFVSTADHHGPICHPFFLNSNLMTAVPYSEINDPNLQYVIVLASANIYLNNSSYPRGLIYQSFHGDEVHTHRLPFFSRQSRQCPVYNFPAFKTQEIAHIKQLVQKDYQNKAISKKEADTLWQLIEDIYNQPNILDCNEYSDQITISNFHLWNRYFGQQKVPANLIYLEQKWLVAQLLRKYHIHQDTIIKHIMFNPDFEPLLFRYFDGIQGAFSTDDNTGTYLFWALPKDSKYRQPLRKQGNFLVTPDASYRIELTPDEIERGLQQKELIPGMLLSYIVLSLYYGVKCLGGFSQVNYLTYMKNAFIRMQLDRGNYKTIEASVRVQTKELGGDFTLAFLGHPNQKDVVPANGLDLILYGTSDWWNRFMVQSKLISLEEAISPMMPEFYRIIYPEHSREQGLLYLSADNIAKLMNLDNKLIPCGELSHHE